MDQSTFTKATLPPIKSSLLRLLVRNSAEDDKGIPYSTVGGLSTEELILVDEFRHFLLQRRCQSQDSQPGPGRQHWQKITQQLEEHLGMNMEYEIGEIWTIELFRSFLEGKSRDPGIQFVPRFRPQVRFGLTAQGFRLIDATNSTFEIKCELSAGMPVADAVQYLNDAGVPTSRDQLLSQVKLDSIVLFKDSVRELLTALLKARLRSGTLEESYSYFRYGSRSDSIWFIQDVKATVCNDGGFSNTPFDRFVFAMDFHVGLGPDVTQIEFDISPPELPHQLLAKGFGAGEFSVARDQSRLTALGLIQDKTHYIENVARLELLIQRSPFRVLSRIGLPLFFMVAMLLLGSQAHAGQSKDLTMAMIPTIFVAMVALQLTAMQGMPRNAPLSILDWLFLASYGLAIWLFVGHLGLPWVRDRIWMLGYLIRDPCDQKYPDSLHCVVETGGSIWVVAVLCIIVIGLVRRYLGGRRRGSAPAKTDRRGTRLAT